MFVLPPPPKYQLPAFLLHDFRIRCTLVDFLSVSAELGSDFEDELIQRLLLSSSATVPKIVREICQIYADYRAFYEELHTTLSIRRCSPDQSEVGGVHDIADKQLRSLIDVDKFQLFLNSKERIRFHITNLHKAVDIRAEYYASGKKLINTTKKRFVEAMRHTAMSSLEGQSSAVRQILMHINIC